MFDACAAVNVKLIDTVDHGTAVSIQGLPHTALGFGKLPELAEATVCTSCPEVVKN